MHWHLKEKKQHFSFLFVSICWNHVTSCVRVCWVTLRRVQQRRVLVLTPRLPSPGNYAWAVIFSHLP